MVVDEDLAAVLWSRLRGHIGDLFLWGRLVALRTFAQRAFHEGRGGVRGGAHCVAFEFELKHTPMRFHDLEKVSGICRVYIVMA